MSLKIVEVTQENWREILKSDLPVVIEFYTSTCPYCKLLTPIFQRLAAEFSGSMVFAMADASKNSDFALGYGVMGVPTLKFFCSGRPVYEIVGYRSESDLREEFRRFLTIHRNCLSQSSPIYM
ncbi:MAG: thioredoxin family protein [Candidatus Bathyarchaeia archaeon]